MVNMNKIKDVEFKVGDEAKFISSEEFMKMNCRHLHYQTNRVDETKSNEFKTDINIACVVESMKY